MSCGGELKHSGRGLSSPRNWRRWPRCWPAWAPSRCICCARHRRMNCIERLRLGVVADEASVATTEREINEFLDAIRMIHVWPKLQAIATRFCWIRPSAGCNARPAADCPIDHCYPSSGSIYKPLIPRQLRRMRRYRRSSRSLIYTPKMLRNTRATGLQIAEIERMDRAAPPLWCN